MDKKKILRDGNPVSDSVDLVFTLMDMAGVDVTDLPGPQALEDQIAQLISSVAFEMIKVHDPVVGREVTKKAVHSDITVGKGRRFGQIVDVKHREHVMADELEGAF